MFWYKSCPKCHSGDLSLERDIHGWYRQCVQCGYLEELEGVSALQRKQALAPVPVTLREVQRAA